MMKINLKGKRLNVDSSGATKLIETESQEIESQEFETARGKDTGRVILL